MKVGTDHFLDQAKRELVPGKGTAMPSRRVLVIHFTSGATAMSSINFWRDLNAGIVAHIVIDRDGTIFQCRAFDRTFGHAGVSRWKDPKTGKKFTNLNSCSIGIELANGGDSRLLTKKFSKLPPVKARHRNGGALSDLEAYPPEQISMCMDVAKVLVDHYHLDDVTGHDCIAPERKNDPRPSLSDAETPRALRLRRVTCGPFSLRVALPRPSLVAMPRKVGRVERTGVRANQSFSSDGAPSWPRSSQSRYFRAHQRPL